MSATPRDPTEQALASIAEATAEHHQAILDLREVFATRGGELSSHVLTPAQPSVEVLKLGLCRSFAVINFSAITVQVGFGGRQAVAGSGFPVPAGSYLQLPLETNLVEIAAAAGDLAGAGSAQFAFVRFEHLASFLAGALSGANIQVAGAIDVSDRAARLLGHVTVDAAPATDVSDRAGRLLGQADVTDRAGRLLGQADVTDRAGRLLGQVAGRAAAGVAAADNPVQVGGVDSGGLARAVLLDPNGRATIAGYDGAAHHPIQTDATGRQIAVGPGAPGAAPVGNPIYNAGTDGANLRGILLDANGRQIAVGAAAAGAAAAGNPVQVGGVDAAALIRALRTNAAGFLMPPTQWSVVSAPAAGAQASASRAAAAGVVHVCAAIIVSIGVNAGASATTATINLRDGATGAGNILASFDFDPAAANSSGGVRVLALSGLALAGTAGNAMTLEFAAAQAGWLEKVTLIGFDQ